MADLVYASLSFKNELGANRLRDVNAGGLSIPILRGQQLFTGSRTDAKIGSLAGGYTLASGAWGNVDAIAGVRILSVSSKFNYTLSDDIRLPDGTVALPRNGNLNLGQTYLGGVGGIRGRLNIGDGRFFIPYYLDAGGGGVPFTWQAYAGLGYRTGFADLSIGYRWLDFQKNGKKQAVENLSLGGAVLAAAFRF
ncbi:MAG: hypothetical protein JO110_01115 [Acetobacteraceae bacterium]|nr:hypothetical protein [Acetobacteraceae bacterium]